MVKARLRSNPEGGAQKAVFISARRVLESGGGVDLRRAKSIRQRWDEPQLSPLPKGEKRETAAPARQEKIRQLACKPGYVWLRPRPERGSHSSGTALARCLLQPTRITSPEKAGALARSTLSLFGFAPGGVYRAVHVTMTAVGSYPTLSP